MPILGGLLAAIFAKLTTFLAVLFGIKIALAAARIIALLAIYGLFYAAITLLIGTIHVPSIPPIMQNGLALLPSNIDVCITAVIGTRLAKFVYLFQRDVLDLKMV